MSKSNIETNASEIKKLKKRIVYLENLLHSLQSGVLDAIIVKNDQGLVSVKTIEGEDQPYRTLVETMSEAALTLTDKGTILHCNRRFCELLTINAVDVIGKSLFEHVPAAEHSCLQQFLSSSKIHNSKEKITVTTADKMSKVLLFSSHEIKFGNIDGISVIATDITELEHEKSKIHDIKAQLTQNEVLFSQLADNMSDIFWRTTETMDKVLYVSPAYVKLWGRPVEEIYKNPYSWLESILPEDRPKVIKNFRSLIDREVPDARFEYRIEQPDGSIRELFVRASLVKSGCETQMIGVVSDVTGIKKAEKYLALQCSISKTLVESENLVSGMSVLLKTVCVNLDWDVGAVWLIDEVAGKMTRFSSWTSDDVLFHEFTELLIPYESYIGNQFFVSGQYKVHWVGNLKNQAYFFRQDLANKLSLVSALVAPVIYNGKRIGFIEFFSKKRHEEDDDITKMFEAISSQIGTSLMQMLTLDKLNHSLKEKEAMLKEIYHRVKNNLQVVSSLLNLQSKSIMDLPTKEIFLKSASRIRAMSLVHEMLYQSGNLAKIDMRDYIKKLLNHLVDIHHVSTQTIKTAVNADPVVLTIEEAIPCGLIINEIISNVFKHAFTADKPGKLVISIKQNGAEVRLGIHDNGIGFPPDFDIEKSTTLGMKLIYGLARQLKGTVSLDQHAGTTVNLVFTPES